MPAQVKMKARYVKKERKKAMERRDRLAGSATVRSRALRRERLLLVLPQVFPGRRRSWTRHLQSRRGARRRSSTWGPLVIRRGRIVVDWFERVDIGQ